jgi:MFS transporter, DHA1 family, multidrug resistance protein
MQQYNKYFTAVLALLIVPISGLSIDIYVPSLPAVAHYFNVDKGLVQLTITTYMVGMGFMQLLAGPISDTFGRKIPYSISMLIYITATLGVPFSSDIYQLLFLRFIQGAAVAVMVVPIRSVITDIFQDRELYKMINYMTMAWSIGPIVAPAIGGYLQHYFGWQTNFYFLAAYSIILFSLTLIYMPETSLHRHPMHLAKIITRYRLILLRWDYAKGVLTNGLLYSIIILFAVVGPFLIQKVLHYSAIEFGRFSLLMGLAWFLGTMTNRFLLHVSYEVKAKFCLLGMLAIAIIMTLLGIAMPLTIYNIVIPLFMLLWLGGIIFPNNFARSIMLFPESTGSANALIGSFVFLIPGLVSGLGTFLKSNSAFPLAITYVGIIALCLLIYWVDLLKKEPQ